MLRPNVTPNHTQHWYFAWHRQVSPTHVSPILPIKCCSELLEHLSLKMQPKKFPRIVMAMLNTCILQSSWNEIKITAHPMNWNSKLNITFCNINNIEKNKEHAAAVHPSETQSLSTYFANQGSINKEIQVFFTSQTLVFYRFTAIEDQSVTSSLCKCFYWNLKTSSWERQLL